MKRKRKPTPRNPKILEFDNLPPHLKAMAEDDLLLPRTPDDVIAALGRDPLEEATKEEIAEARRNERIYWARFAGGKKCSNDTTPDAMKTKRKQQNRRTLWTPARVKSWLEHCPESDAEEMHVCRGWVVDGEFYCAECVHRVVENNIPLPPQAIENNPMRGSIFVPLDADGAKEKMMCEGCGARL